jgi:hypothetical protein
MSPLTAGLSSSHHTSSPMCHFRTSSHPTIQNKKVPKKKDFLALEVMVASHFSRKEFNLVADLNLSGGNSTGVSL